MILLIDNYDSFTYNLYQAIGQLYEDITVIRNDKLTIEQIQNMQPEAIIISPARLPKRCRHLCCRYREIQRNHSNFRRMPRPPIHCTKHLAEMLYMPNN
ncbi:MAG: glutamine amidotransferase-related protein [Eubacteriales bacterium]